MLKCIKSKFHETYMTRDGDWVPEMERAQKFATSAELVMFCEGHGIAWYDIHEIEVPPVRTYQGEPDPKPRQVIFNNGSHF